MKRNKIIVHNILQDLHLFANIFLIIKATLFHAQKWKFIFIAEQFFFLSSPYFFFFGEERKSKLGLCVLVGGLPVPLSLSIENSLNLSLAS